MWQGVSTVTEPILDQVARAGHATALRWGEVTISYGELGECARALSEQLTASGVGRRDFVPLLMTGGPASPIAMLAAMRLGAPFVPVDASWPRERLRSTLRRLDPKVVLTDRDPGSWSDLGPEVLEVDCLPATPSGPADRGLPGPAGRGPSGHPVPGSGDVAGLDDVIYGFFTSGTTGAPKCALNLHRGLLNRFRVMSDRFGSGQVVLQNSPHVFDSSLWQLLWPLMSGGCVVHPEHEGLDLIRTIETIGRYGVTMTDFVPSVFGTLVEVLHAEPELATRLTSLRYLLIGGEEINPKAVHRFRDLVPQVRVINTYGPTEASIGFVFHEVRDTDRDEIPLGTPIDNTVAVVVTEAGTIAEEGELGEICAGGVCVGAGYLDEPELTAEGFVPNPFPGVPGARLYRTGDLGYYGPDGLLRFAGRRDHQVKIGGVRIELLEVESALLAHPAVREAKVVVVGEGEARALVGFVVVDRTARPAEGDGAAPDPAHDTAWLADHARSLLPGSSVPRRFVLLDQLPRTPNGKTDRTALTALAGRQPALSGRGTAGAGLTEDEAAVARVWTALLGRDGFTPASDFFAEGGTSLRAYRLSLALTARCGFPISVRDLAARPTLRDQAELIRRPGAVSPITQRTESAVRADAVLAPGICRTRDLPPPGSRPAPPPAGRLRRVLLTGATGFLGRQLLADLLRHTDATVYCLIRSTGEGSATQRLATVMDLVADPTGQARVVPLEGDLGRDGFGWAVDRFRALADEVDTVVHAGARVNLVAGYQAMRPANVGGVNEILRLAATGLPKRLVHFSTLGVLPPVPGVRLDEVAAPGEDLPHDGYGQSKWAAEHLFAAARRRGIPSTVIRLGEVMPHSRTGQGDERSVLTGLLRACARVGLRFATPAVMDWTPVDLVGEVTVRSLVSGALPDGALHLLAPTAMRLDHLMEQLGAITPLEPVGYAGFWKALAARSRDDAGLAGVLSMIPGPDRTRDAARLDGVLGDARTAYRSEGGEKLCADLGLSPARGDDHSVAAYLRWLSARI